MLSVSIRGRCRLWWVALASVLLCPALAQAAEVGDPARCAPPVGDDKYTINIAAPLKDVLKQFREITGIPLSVNVPALHNPDGTVRSHEQIPVVLEFTDAPLQQILLSLCEQTGTVYDSYAGGKHIALREGNVKVDGRPTVTVGDYTIRVVSWTASMSTNMRFQWGSEPTEPDYSDGVNIEMLVRAKDDEADEKCAGFDSELTALLDNGALLKPDERAHRSISWRTPMGFDVRRQFQASLSLPLPPQDAGEIARLEGALMLFKEVRTTEVEFKPDKGTKFEKGGVSGTLVDLTRSGMTVKVCIEADYDLPADSAQHVPFGGHGHSVTLIARDGREQPNSGSGGGYNRDQAKQTAHLKMEYTFPNVPEDFEVDRVRFRVVRKGAADERLPFVIEHIPLS